MPSRADPVLRMRMELALRGVALLAVGGLAVLAWTGTPAGARDASVTGSRLDSALAAWTGSPPRSATLRGPAVPGRYQRDWLLALRRTGLAVSWQAADSSGTAMVVEPVASRPPRVSLVAAPGSRVALSDALGVVDSATTATDGTVQWTTRPVGLLAADGGSSSARAATRDSLVIRPILVLGHAGWEAKFTVAALEESGWSVATRLTVAPGAVVRQGSNSGIDTASFSAVMVLDSAPPIDAGVLRRFVLNGGGLVAAGAGIRHPALRGLLPGNAASVSPGVSGALQGPAPREGLRARTLSAVSPLAVTLERRADRPVVAGQRIGAGRVVAVGYEDTWRARMIPEGANAPDEHRDWWSGLVASVANAVPVALGIDEVDEAPLASMVAAFGQPGPVAPGAGPSVRWEILLGALALAALLAEWLSRRFAGRP